MRGSYFSRFRFSEGILGDPGGLSRFRMRSSRRVPDALLRPPGGLAKAVEGFVADRGQLGPNAKRGLLWSSPRSSNRDPIHRIGCDFGAGADLIADLLGHIKTIWIFLGSGNTIETPHVPKYNRGTSVPGFCLFRPVFYSHFVCKHVFSSVQSRHRVPCFPEGFLFSRRGDFLK